ncbi:MAG: hypothetical protein Q9193_003592, partial [Seirophora villosa]
PLGDQYGERERENVVQAARKLEEDDCERHRKPGYAAHSGTCRYQSIYSRCDTALKLSLCATATPYRGAGEFDHQVLHDVTHDATEEAAYNHGRYVDPGRDFDTERYCRQKALDDEGDPELSDYQGDKSYLEYRPPFDERYTAESPSPDGRRFDEESTQSTAQHTEQDEYKDLEESPICNVANFEDDNFPRTVGIQEFK